MRRLPLLLALVAVVAACEWDGPPRDVRVVPSAPTPTTELAAGDAGGSAGSGRGEPPDVPATTPDGRVLPPRPGSFGAIDLPRTVAVVGDSLTVSATDEITDALHHVGVPSVVVDGRESRRMVAGSSDLPSGLSAIDDIRATAEPDLWVVALGTNDVGAGATPERFLDDLRTTLDALPDTAPVVWVDVWIRDRADAVVDANGIIRDELAARGGPSYVVDWFSHGTAADTITGDGIHLTEHGQRAFADAIVDGVLRAGLD